MMELPESFKRGLAGISPRLSAVWSPAGNAWYVYYQTSAGRTLKLLEGREEDTTPSPPDQRLLARIAAFDLATMDDPKYAKDIATREYNEFKYREAKKVANQRAETAYKARHLASLWQHTAEGLERRKQYSEKPMKQKLLAAMGKLNPTTGRLFQKMGMPNITGKPLTLKGGD